jgi:hypothetical protein
MVLQYSTRDGALILGWNFFLLHQVPHGTKCRKNKHFKENKKCRPEEVSSARQEFIFIFSSGQ